MANRDKCGLVDCWKILGPGAAEVAFEEDGGIKKIRVCAEHAWILMNAPAGTFSITPDRKLKRMPTKRIIT